MSLPTKLWRPSFGPLPAALAGRIPVEPAFSDRIRAAANRFYIDEMAEIAAEHDEEIARERQAHLDETMDAAVEARRTGVLSPVAARLLEACDTIFASAAERKSAADQTSGGDRRPLPEVALSTRRNRDEGDAAQPYERGPRTRAGATKGGRHEDLAAPARDFPLNPAGKLVELRSGQGVAVFGDVAWDGRRA